MSSCFYPARIPPHSPVMFHPGNTGWRVHGGLGKTEVRPEVKKYWGKWFSFVWVWLKTISILWVIYIIIYKLLLWLLLLLWSGIRALAGILWWRFTTASQGHEFTNRLLSSELLWVTWRFLYSLFVWLLLFLSPSEFLYSSAAAFPDITKPFDPVGPVLLFPKAMSDETGTIRPKLSEIWNVCTIKTEEFWIERWILAQNSSIINPKLWSAALVSSFKAPHISRLKHGSSCRSIHRALPHSLKSFSIVTLRHKAAKSCESGRLCWVGNAIDRSGRRGVGVSPSFLSLVFLFLLTQEEFAFTLSLTTMCGDGVSSPQPCHGPLLFALAWRTATRVACLNRCDLGLVMHTNHRLWDFVIWLSLWCSK